MNSKDKKIRLVHLSCGLGIGGAEKVIYDLSRFADASKFEVSVVSLGSETGMLEQFQAQKIEVHYLPEKENTQSSRIWNAIQRLWASIQLISQLNKEQKIELIHAHMVYPGIVAAFVKLRFPSIKICFTSHNFNLKSPLKERFLKWTKALRNIDILFSHEMYTATYKKDAVVIPNGINIRDYQQTKESYSNRIFTFLCIGRLEDQKNQIALIEPALALKKQGYTFKILLAGNGSNRAMIAQAIQENQLGGTIELLGIRRDIPQLCQHADCLIIPSLWEGLPIVLLEAGASSLPVISTKVGSIPSLINEESLGYLIDDCSQLAKTMQTVMDDYLVAAQKGKQLYKKIEKTYSIAAIVKQHESIYQQLAQ